MGYRHGSLHPPPRRRRRRSDSRSHTRGSSHPQPSPANTKVVIMVSTKSACCVVVCVMALVIADYRVLAAPLAREETKIAITLNGDEQAVEKEVHEASAGRAKRDLFSELVALEAETQDETLHETRHVAGRSRRSATWMLHATIKLCTKYQSLCKQIEVMEGNTRVSIRLEAE